ncbi:MAG: putative metal-binding motif-containing protein, partial [Deltaproteobacteria bacterium]|nr:putative metal-binding motif-containing protein [Deltaproteobacteria bacterium]
MGTFATALHARGALLLLPLAGAVIAGCGAKETEYKALYVEVSADPGIAPDRLHLWLLKTGDVRHVAPRDPDGATEWEKAVEGADLSSSPLLVQVVPEEVFTGAITVVVIGKKGGEAVGRGVAEVDLAERQLVKLRLAASPEGCDADRDGFPDVMRPECCPVASALCDCDDADARVTPVGYEDECTRCGFGPDLEGDAVDDDCDKVKARCRDADGDQARDCAPAWCQPGGESEDTPQCATAAKQVDCDPADKTVWPGAQEVCNGKDDDCDGLTDEGSEYRGNPVGQPCIGEGECGPGTVECHPALRLAVCSSNPDGSAHADRPEACGNKKDDDCNGQTDEGCETGDSDGDGVPDAVEDKYCTGNGWAKYHAEVFPEYDPVARPDVPETVKHLQPEPCCQLSRRDLGAAPAVCDLDCSGTVTWCSESDADGDGYPAGPDTDCNDDDPTVHAGAPEKCGDGVDQDCKGGDVPCASIIDKDKDGFAPGDFPLDCDDDDPAVHPWALETCNGRDDDCDRLVFEGNPGPGGGFDEPCGSDVGECRKGLSVCMHQDVEPKIQVVCVDAIDPIAETCDGKDNDCDGDTDNGFSYGGTPVWTDPTDVSKGHPPCDGVGECGANPEVVGQVECLPDGTKATCSTNPDGSNRQDKAEVCNDRDDDCDGTSDEDLTSVEMSTCKKAGVCGTGMTSIVAKCSAGVWDCKYEAVPGYEWPAEKSCDEADNDCDGETDEDFEYTDEINIEPVGKGARCGTGACANGWVVCSDAKDGLKCDTSGRISEESCDGLDNDCDGDVDEDPKFRYLGTPVWIDPKDPAKGANACTGVGECGKAPGLVECQGPDTAGCSTNPGGSAAKDKAESCNAKDDDCDGQTDEELTNVNDSDCLRTGVCWTGLAGIVAKCVTGAWLCDYSKVGGYEQGQEKTCDGKDNDCDSETDEDFVALNWNGTPLGKDAACGTGACAGGTMRCIANGSGIECSTNVLVKAEVCDRADNDCNGLTDDGQTYLGANVGDACQGVGECGKGPGIVECHAASKKAVCSTNPDGTSPKNVAETCNGKDDDCDGLTDDGLGIESPDCTCRVVGQCSKTNVDATCKLGLWKCDYSLVPAYESPAELSCDGKDNDCDGQTDEDFTYTDWDGTKKSKGQGCGTGACAPGVVVCASDAKGLVCSTDTAKKAESCNGKDDDCDGQTDENGAALCDDVDPCTNDSCPSGACVNKIPTGYCDIDKQCVAAGTGNPQNQCEHCVPEKSLTAWTDDADGAACNLDNNGCTQGDRCVAGTCKVGTTQTCTEKTDACNKGRCVSDNANAFHCVADPVSNGTPCDDANSCTRTDVCTGGKCAGAAYLCEDYKTCTDNVCDGKGGCSFPLKDNYCLISGNCVSAGAQDPAAQCKACRPTLEKFLYVAKDEGTPCSDNNACTDNDICSSGACVSQPRNCADSNPCTTDTCQHPTGCIYTPNAGLECSDGNLCTKNDRCGGPTGSGNPTVCTGEAFACNDLLFCTEDKCNGTGCSFDVLDGFCLIGGTCFTQGALDPANECKACLSAVSKTQYSIRPHGTKCDDHSACTNPDTCQGGVCTAGPTVDCNDNVECTTDSCDPAVGCQHANLTGTDCNDGDSCTVTDKCNAGVCAGTPKNCPQPNPDCSVGDCVCGSQTCSTATANTCSPLDVCMCGTEAACSGINPNCTANSCTCDGAGADCITGRADKCLGSGCRCGSGPWCSTAINPNS